MRCGLLWYDGDSRSGVGEKVARAAQRYVQKMGRSPTVCYLHPGACAAAAQADLECRLAEGTILVRLTPTVRILPNHFWLGEEEPAAGGQARRPAAASG